MPTIDLSQDELDVLFDILHKTKGSSSRTRRRYVDDILYKKLAAHRSYDLERSADIIGRVEFIEDIGGSKGIEPTPEELERMRDYWS